MNGTAVLMVLAGILLAGASVLVDKEKGAGKAGSWLLAAIVVGVPGFIWLMEGLG